MPSRPTCPKRNCAEGGARQASPLPSLSHEVHDSLQTACRRLTRPRHPRAHLDPPLGPSRPRVSPQESNPGIRQTRPRAPLFLSLSGSPCVVSTRAGRGFFALWPYSTGPHRPSIVGICMRFEANLVLHPLRPHLASRSFAPLVPFFPLHRTLIFSWHLHIISTILTLRPSAGIQNYSLDPGNNPDRPSPFLPLLH